jgi:hypothetical protein
MAFDDWAASEIDLLASGTRLRQPSAHTSVFKYIGLNTETSWKHLERTLRELELTGSTAVSLNDPFELSPYVFDDLRPSLVAAALRDTGVRETVKDEAYDPNTKYADIEPYRKKAYEYLQQVNRYSRIISFCERSDSPLLWSHYAHSYQGACLHFLGRAFKKPGPRLGYVSYSTYRPVYPLSLALTLSANSGGFAPDAKIGIIRAESEKLYFFTKASDWAYENEVRVVYNSNRIKSVSFDPDGLVSMILGPHMKPEDMVRLMALVKRSKLPNLPIRQAKLSTNSFSVEVD